MDLKLNTGVGEDKDMLFINGECPVVTETPEVVRQRLIIRLRTLYQEWFLNVDYGVPYLERILGHKVSKSTVDAILQEHIYKEKGVLEIVEWSSVLRGRDYSCTFKVKTIGGVTDTISAGEW